MSAILTSGPKHVNAGSLVRSHHLLDPSPVFCQYITGKLERVHETPLDQDGIKRTGDIENQLFPSASKAILSRKGQELCCSDVTAYPSASEYGHS